jgi:hypothetical protein
MAMTFRTAGPWGAGKGSALTSAEVDQNFWEIIQRLDALDQHPPEAVSIAEISIAGNQITFTMTDASQQGPFTLPTATWAARGEWAAETFYTGFQVVSYQGGLYLVLRNHTSEASFDALANDGAGHNFYSQILAPPDPPDLPYDCGMFYNFTPPIDGSLMLQHVAVRDFVVNGDFLHCTAFMRVAPTTQIIVFEIRKVSDELDTETTVGTITFDPSFPVTFDGGMFGQFASVDSPASDIQFSQNDRLNIYAPTPSPAIQDDTAIGLAITISAITVTS